MGPGPLLDFFHLTCGKGGRAPGELGGSDPFSPGGREREPALRPRPSRTAPPRGWGREPEGEGRGPSAPRPSPQKFSHPSPRPSPARPAARFGVPTGAREQGQGPVWTAPTGAREQGKDLGERARPLARLPDFLPPECSCRDHGLGVDFPPLKIMGREGRGSTAPASPPGNRARPGEAVGKAWKSPTPAVLSCPLSLGFRLFPPKEP